MENAVVNKHNSRFKPKKTSDVQCMHKHCIALRTVPELQCFFNVVDAANYCLN